MTAKEIRTTLEESFAKNEIGYRAATRSWVYRERALSERELVRRVAYEQGCSMHLTELAVAVWANDLKYQADVRLSEWVLALEKQPVDEAPLAKFLQLMQKSDTDPDMALAHLWAMKQWLWQVKRNILHKSVTWHTVPIFWSQEGGTGKSYNVLRLLTPLSDFTRSVNVQDLGERFSKKLLASTRVAFFDEFAGAGDVDKATFKAMITGRPLEGREMYSEVGFHDENRLACIATSNLPPPHGFEDTSSGARRFWSIHCGASSRRDLDARHTALDHLQPDDLWRAVSVFTPSVEKLLPPHIAARMDAERRDRIRARDSFESFFREGLEDSGPDDRIPLKAVQESYRVYLSTTRLRPVRMSQEALQERLTALGARCINKSSYRFLCAMRLKTDQ